MNNLSNPKSYQLDLPPIIDPEIQKRALLFQFIYSMTGLFIGSLCILGGIILAFHGIAGSTSWIAKMLGFESNISDAPPGIILFVVGLFIIWVTMFKVKANKK